MTPTQAQWRELQQQVHTLQRKRMTPDELRQLAEVLTLIDRWVYKS